MPATSQENGEKIENGSLPIGKYSSPKESDLRGPCPALNCLANHGYLPRDGRGLHADQVYWALTRVGLSPVLRAALSNPIFLEWHGKQKQESMPFFAKAWYLFRNPWAIFLSNFGMRDPDQVDSQGKRFINLDQTSRDGAIEHDISLSRLDRAQGDCATANPELVRDLLESSSDGGKTISLEDLAAFRKRRIEKQKADNPGVVYGTLQHKMACGEIVLLIGVFGDGFRVPVEYVRAVFAEERLPIEEGWKKRSWWSSLGLLEVIVKTKKVVGLVGYTAEE